MKKLEDIPKKVIYTVPEGYFDRLPGIIQSRVADKGEKKAFQISWGLSFKYALPVLLIAAVGIFWLQQSQVSLEDKLNQISEEQISYFLEEADLTSDELVETVTWSTEDLDALEENVFSALANSESDLNSLTEDYTIDLENF